jgi:hypothetical protein
MANVAGIQRLQQSRAAGNAEKDGMVTDKVEDAIARHQDHVNKSYAESMKEIENNREAREAKGLGQLLGTIFLGPIIGTLIGGAIAECTNDGDEEAAREAKKQTGLEDHMVERAYDDFDAAKKDLDEVRSQTDDIDKFGDSLRESNQVPLM